MTDETAPKGRRAAQAANLFDLRRIIGGVFTVLGVPALGVHATALGAAG